MTVVMTFVGKDVDYDVFRIVAFVANYDRSCLLGLSLIGFVAYRVCRL